MLDFNELRDLVPNPKETIRKLDEYIIGQEEAKKNLAVMLLHRAVLKLARKGKIQYSNVLERSHVLMLGPSGTGKTSIIKALAEISGIPITISDVTSITAAGYVGNKVEDILYKHYELCGEYVTDAFNKNLLDAPAVLTPQEVYVYNDARDRMFTEVLETGIIYLDEIDKIRIRTGRGSDDTDINGDMVQNELLKILDGGVVSLRSARSAGHGGSNKELDTSNMFFICGGAFQGLSEIIAHRINKKAGIGFNSNLKVDETQEDLFKYVTNEDLITYGFKPEFLGRVPLRAPLSPLSKDVLTKIMLEAKNSVWRQYQDFYSVFGIDLVITEEAVDLIAEKAIALKIGARSLKTIFSDLLLSNMTDLLDYANTQVIVDKEMVLRHE